RAKEEGWRARSAFKLLQLDEEFALFKGCERAVDLCAAPGSWTQVLARQVLARQLGVQDDDPSAGTRIVSVDINKMAPIQGVVTLQGDITAEDTARRVIDTFGGHKADIVVCDGAPDVTGLHDLDEYLQQQLVVAALTISTFLLKPGASFVTKVFRGRDSEHFLIPQFHAFFSHVTLAKPSSSRNASLESFVVCKGYRPPTGFVPTMPLSLAPGPPGVVSFVAVGDLDGLDADSSYQLEEGHSVIEPLARPIDTPDMYKGE
ncbi:tRNA (cytidine(32)/guanosine(34)-2-O)-methyltransferase, Trm7, partial [Kipferlia bialata]